MTVRLGLFTLWIYSAKELNCSLESLWEMCKLLRCDLGGETYAIRSLPLQQELAEKYDDVEDAVIIAMCSTERTSSMVENLILIG